ncbi:MAG: hypothetical protein FWE71_09780 [Nocardioidaceae bacterium]|nr:hypothetical protein [Nocardioidaceae bacterium]MCL2611918.1 hypothetical protein [Nocardioidaceae bacterium]
MRRRLLLPAAVVALVAATGLAGCGSGASKPAAAASTSAAPYVDVPSGVQLTAPGTKLGLGDGAVVGWRPRQDTVAALSLRVDRIERTTFDQSFKGWQISSSLAATTPYFARVTATNVSKTDLGGIPVQLWGEDDAGRLVSGQPFDKRTFAPCHPTVLPKPFKPGDHVDLCFVYLISPGHDLTSVAFEPPSTDGQLAPITWSGPISTKVEPPAQATTSPSSRSTAKGSGKASGKTSGKSAGKKSAKAKK